MEKYMYKIENLNKDFTDGDGVCHALKSINLSISTGQMVAVVGKSGSGKSTLFNILGAIDRATDGRVIINGKNIAELSEGELCKYRSETVGFVFQAFHIIESYTVYDNTELPLIINKVPKSQRDEMIKRTVERVGLSEELSVLLDYLKTSEPKDEFTKGLDEEVKSVRKDQEWRENYMTWEMKLDYEYRMGEKAGIEKGIEQRIKDLVAKKLAKGKSVSQIAEECEETEERIKSIIEEIEKEREMHN